MKILTVLLGSLLVVFLTSCGGGGDASNDKLPLLLPNNFIPLDYEYNSDYSAFDPSSGGTRGVVLGELEQPKFIGDNFPFDFVAVMQFSGKIARFNKTGEIIWAIENGYGRFVSVGGEHIFANSSNDINKVSVISLNGEILSEIQFSRDINFIHEAENRLVVAFNESNMPIQIYEWDPIVFEKGRLLFESIPVSYPRAVKINGNLMYIADTFGHKVIVQNIQNGLIEYQFDAYYPNDIDINNGFMYVAEEHLDRIVAVDLSSKKRYISLAPPASKVWDPYAWNADIDPASLYGGNCVLVHDGLELIRSYASEACSGKNTLYAPNGIDVIDGGVLVADTDNARILYARVDGAISILSGLNNPTKLFFIK